MFYTILGCFGAAIIARVLKKKAKKPMRSAIPIYSLRNYINKIFFHHYKQ